MREKKKQPRVRDIRLPLRSRRERLDTVRATAAWGDIVREIRSGRFGKFYPSGAANSPIRRINSALH
jgi:hypothetical protein